MSLTADTEMLEAVRAQQRSLGQASRCREHGGEIPRDVLARYVGVYKGIYEGPRERMRCCSPAIN